MLDVVDLCFSACCLLIQSAVLAANMLPYCYDMADNSAVASAASSILSALPGVGCMTLGTPAVGSLPSYRTASPSMLQVSGGQQPQVSGQVLPPAATSSVDPNGNVLSQISAAAAEDAAAVGPQTTTKVGHPS